MKDIIKNFNDDEDWFTNQQMIGFKDMFRGLIVKQWIAGNEHCVNFHIYNKISTNYCVKFYVECWKKDALDFIAQRYKWKFLK